jgi:pyridoxamine 5'-phosphate oxidase
MKDQIQALRKEYRHHSLEETDLAPDPLHQFEHWFQQALQADLPEPNAMIVSTVSATGAPSSRTVLLKEISAGGFVFFTNYLSRKGRELAANAQIAVLFYWPELERQVRIQGQAERLPAAESDAYFAGRPRGSQIGAWASAQSEVIASRTELEQRQHQLEQQYADQPIPRPPHWGGYRVIPHEIEFWQGRPNRLHDRLVYLQAGTQWQILRRSP